jgi:hypothetical protein
MIILKFINEIKDSISYYIKKLKGRKAWNVNYYKEKN